MTRLLRLCLWPARAILYRHNLWPADPREAADEARRREAADAAFLKGRGVGIDLGIAIGEKTAWAAAHREMRDMDRERILAAADAADERAQELEATACGAFATGRAFGLQEASALNPVVLVPPAGEALVSSGCRRLA